MLCMLDSEVLTSYRAGAGAFPACLPATAYLAYCSLPLVLLCMLRIYISPNKA